MATLAQTTERDLELTNGQFRVVRDVAEEAAIVLQNKFLFLKGEFFLDTRLGVPYLTFVFVKNPDLLLIRSLFRNLILSTEGVKSVVDLSLELDRATRKLRFSFKALAENGRIITGGSGQPFIVEP